MHTSRASRPRSTGEGGRSAAALLEQARALRRQARRVGPVLADAHLRRAAALSREAWSLAVRGETVAAEDARSAVTAA